MKAATIPCPIIQLRLVNLGLMAKRGLTRTVGIMLPLSHGSLLLTSFGCLSSWSQELNAMSAPAPSLASIPSHTDLATESALASCLMCSSALGTWIAACRKLAGAPASRCCEAFGRVLGKPELRFTPSQVLAVPVRQSHVGPGALGQSSWLSV